MVLSAGQLAACVNSGDFSEIMEFSRFLADAMSLPFSRTSPTEKKVRFCMMR
jgi:hypothetical protein